MRNLVTGIFEKIRTSMVHSGATFLLINVANLLLQVEWTYFSKIFLGPSILSPFYLDWMTNKISIRLCHNEEPGVWQSGPSKCGAFCHFWECFFLSNLVLSMPPVFQGWLCCICLVICLSLCWLFSTLVWLFSTLVWLFSTLVWLFSDQGWEKSS